MIDRLARILFSPGTGTGPTCVSLLSALARLVFASVLLHFFWGSFATKIDGFGLSAGAYIQILPRAFDAAGYDPTAIAWPLRLVVLLGTAAEFTLPLLVVLGLATRPAALGMIGFIVVMSLTDIYGHGVGRAVIGLPFDADPYGKILDQRLLWVFTLAVPMLLGGGALSVDAAVSRWFGMRRGRLRAA
ncbi:DoxX family protein [Solirhodobacter olei]|uniref:DoxX family protein n=1 Tax=Solirhodobacter olei TaxID=2493082 RepID=UPI000FDC5D2E|nr:DoxX family membrane protein [Solirhodobacter olei]